MICKARAGSQPPSRAPQNRTITGGTTQQVLPGAWLRNTSSEWAAPHASIAQPYRPRCLAPPQPARPPGRTQEGKGELAPSLTRVSSACLSWHLSKNRSLPSPSTIGLHATTLA